MNKKITEKDVKDWENFLNSNEKLPIKDKDKPNDYNFKIEKTIDLHGLSLDEANKEVFRFIESNFKLGVKKLNIITGKGNRSNNHNDPYSSKHLGILKYSVPEYVKNNSDLMKMIKHINFDDVEQPSKGNFYILLKK